LFTLITMSKKKFPVLLILLALFFGQGCFLFKKKCDCPKFSRHTKEQGLQRKS